MNRPQAERIVLGAMLMGRSQPANPALHFRSDWHQEVRAACVRASQVPGGCNIISVGRELAERPKVHDDLLAMAREYAECGDVLAAIEVVV